MSVEDKDKCTNEDFLRPQRDKSLEVQLVLSLLIGTLAFFTFCFLRPRWPALYAARKRRLDHTLGLPSLSNSAFGWIPQLYKVTEEQILASAGLDAFVFLTFFKMSTRLFAVLAFFATVVLWPINYHYNKDFNLPIGGGHKQPNDTDMYSLYASSQTEMLGSDFDALKDKSDKDHSFEKSYLWAYVVFTYFFAGLTVYYLNRETFRIIRFRQDYLGTQSTVTDRTFRLTGIPSDLRSEDAIKDLIEKLDIGTVDKVTVCREWKRLDDLVDLRDATLRSLEASWATFLKYQSDKKTKSGSQRRSGYQTAHNDSGDQDDEEANENGHLLDSEERQWDSDDEGRPKVNLRYGALGLRSRNVDAINYYEERLRRLDAKITEARKQSYTPTDMAIVTMDSVASCQMVIQARIDPRPGRLLTKPTPSPSDLVWRNTYSPRGIRRLKSWAVTLFIVVLTIVWIVPTAALASLLSICTINRVAPDVGDWLQDHAIVHALFQNGLPALVVSLLNVAVPYLYDFLSNQQGMISQGDVELSVISKNYFFTFFNTFFVFAISSTGFEFWSVMHDLQDFFKDTSKIPRVIAQKVENLSVFYICFIMLQGIGLMPFRILEAGSVFFYPITRWMSKTPRDFEELKKPPIFQYGFFLPTALLVFNLCMIYSVLDHGFLILITGTIYFSLGYFTFKYMVLYAMDQPQHATGGAWRIICQRIIVGLVVFEVVIVGQIATMQAFVQSVCILPLVPLTIWYSYYVKKRFEPLTRYIALRAIRADEDSDDAAAMDDAFVDEAGPRPSQTILRRGSTLDEYKERGLSFVNPSLVVALQQPWLYKDPPPPLRESETEGTEEYERPILQGVDSTLGIGDENVWQDNGVAKIFDDDVVFSLYAATAPLMTSNSRYCHVILLFLLLHLPYNANLTTFLLQPPYLGANFNTTSQILLSRGAAGTRPTRSSTRLRPCAPQDETMATAALISDVMETINVVPAGAANVQRLSGDDYSVLQLDARPPSMRLPTEIVQYIYLFLTPEDFDSARYVCRHWFLAGCNHSLLVKMLKRGGWWSSLQQILGPLSTTQLSSINQERIMGKWISRECDLASLRKSAFKQVGFTDFSGLVPGSTSGGLHGTLVFTLVRSVADERGQSVGLASHGRNAVAILMEGRIDALTNDDLSRWFPLTSPSDFLYFLPARSGIDTGRKLRLVSSTAALGNQLGPAGNIFQGFETNVLGSGSSPGLTAMDPGGGDAIVHDIHSVDDLPYQRGFEKACDGHDQQRQHDESLQSTCGGSIDHYRAVPLSDGNHILFTDPGTRNLCLGSDAPAGSLNRLTRKVWFRPPANASSPLPVLYTAGADTRHGVRVIATFSVDGVDSLQFNSCGPDPPKAVDANKQIIVYYTIPPDMFLHISRDRSRHSVMTSTEDKETDGLSGWVDWRPEGSYRDMDFMDDPLTEGTAYPLEIRGQPVAICSNLVELALDSGPDMVLWAFSAQGWARTWAMHTGREDAFNHTVVQHDGSLRQVDSQGDYVMAEVEQVITASDVDAKSHRPFGRSVTNITSSSPGWMKPSVERYRRLISGLQADGMGGTVRVDLVEEMNGLARMDVELR
ncbi:hypothetical protein FZEAL_3815 [Fusarium zealandicum]|uniref:F-box domain-containing protein n=1 Tax=Fusarium zealandicum TaxID=1053134 RepID=A0A8H4UNL1_9HYPO|nr:hypothetical protein FZEAL_3815 [Fusarium zealandicum]